MTSREAYKNLLIELNKVNAPTILLDDFNYLINKAIILVVNKRYNIYDTTQQTTDDLRVLTSTAFLKPEDNSKIDFDAIDNLTALKLLQSSYIVNFPLDYFHLLNCVCVFEIQRNSRCSKQGDLVLFVAKRLTADSWPVIEKDYYNRPKPEQPYYYIHNINTSTELPTNPFKEGSVNLERNTVGTDTAIPNTFTFNGEEISVKERKAEIRYGNYSSVRCEIRCGQDTSLYLLKGVLIDYLKTPKYIKLTLDLLDLIEDTSLVLEFPEPFCMEIINELVHLAMENIQDARLLTHIPVTTSVASPAQQSTKK